MEYILSVHYIMWYASNTQHWRTNASTIVKIMCPEPRVLSAASLAKATSHYILSRTLYIIPGGQRRTVPATIVTCHKKPYIKRCTRRRTQKCGSVDETGRSHTRTCDATMMSRTLSLSAGIGHASTDPFALFALARRDYIVPVMLHMF